MQLFNNNGLSSYPANHGFDIFLANARCFRLVDCGNHLIYLSDCRPVFHRMFWISWEFCTDGFDTKVHNQFFSYSEEGHCSLIQLIEKLSGREIAREEMDKFDLTCLIDTYFNLLLYSADCYQYLIKNITPSEGNLRLPKAANKAVEFYLTPDAKHEEFIQLPDFIQQKIMDSYEWDFINLPSIWASEALEC